MSGANGSRRGRRCAPALVLGAVLLTTPVSALGAGNDLVLRRLSECTGFATVDGRQTCAEVEPDEQGFTDLARDLGLAFSPKVLAPAETLGEAGFEYAFELIFNVVDSSADYWQRAVADQDPSDLLLVSQFHIRKGLPFSFEIGAILSHLFDSSMWALGVELAWALHEDTLWPVPDLGVRAFVSNVVGSTDMNLTVAGFDAMLGVPVGVANVFSLTPYAGYNFTTVFASSRLLDASPEDARPPVAGTNGQGAIKPEFVFDNRSNYYSRFVGGLRFRYVVLNATIETMIGVDVQSFALHLGLDF